MEATLKEQQREADIARRAEDMRKRMDKMSEVYREEVRGRVCWLAAPAVWVVCAGMCMQQAAVAPSAHVTPFSSCAPL